MDLLKFMKEDPFKMLVSSDKLRNMVVDKRTPGNLYPYKLEPFPGDKDEVEAKEKKDKEDAEKEQFILDQNSEALPLHLYAW